MTFILENSKDITPEILEFIQQSNAIEGVHDADSLKQAVLAWKFLMSQKKLTVGVILKTHKILMLNQPLQPDEKGYFRKCEVTIGGRFGLNWVRVPDAMEAWVKLVNETDHSSFPAGDDVKFHHVEYEHIHPFVDGNGRTGRLFMNYERVRSGLKIAIIHTGEEQMEYYKWFK